MVMQLHVFPLMELFHYWKRLSKAEFQNVIESVSSFGKAVCLSASISLNPQKGHESRFIVGFNSNTPELNSSKVWEVIKQIR
ncbi:protein SEH1-like [Cicer arietinum]|uniref:protein SEH1-like n=1 Tax=Cicer arietinum TaxID=3827 RepID=UPI003CC56F23